MSATFIVKVRADDTEEWQWIEWPTKERRDEAAFVYEMAGGLEIETVDIYREAEVVP